MPQYGFPVTAFKTSAGAQTQPVLGGDDAQGNLPVQGGGVSSALGVTSATVVKGSAGRLRRISVLSAGTSGSFSINDLATTSNGSAGNQIWGAANSGVTGGQVIALDAPVSAGISVTSVTSGGALSLFYD